MWPHSLWPVHALRTPANGFGLLEKRLLLSHARRNEDQRASEGKVIPLDICTGFTGGVVISNLQKNKTENTLAPGRRAMTQTKRII
jgi:hypothetical protein